MIQRKTISLVLPCRNEGSHLHEVIKRVPDVVDQVIIVSNKSTDDTVKIAKEIAKKDKRLIVVEDNRTVGGIGYGFAHMTGIETADGDIVVAADGDATYPLADIEKIVKYLLKERYDFISCNRYPLQNGVKIPFKLQFGVNLLNWEIRLLYGIPIKDALSGMWAFRKEVSHDLKLTMGEWNLSPQIKINAASSKNIRFTEYSIAQNQRMGETKQDYFKTGFNHAKWIFVNRFRHGKLVGEETK